MVNAAILPLHQCESAASSGSQLYPQRSRRHTRLLARSIDAVRARQGDTDAAMTIHAGFTEQAQCGVRIA